MPNPWTADDMSIVALRLTQHLTGLLVDKGVVRKDELQSVYDSLGEQLKDDPAGANALAYLRAVMPEVLRRP